jgi:uncharacterized membrane protein HdeD (DUF308 family)
MNELSLAADATRVVVRKTWWIMLIQGIAALIIGVLLFTNPASTLFSLVILLGAFWLVGGIFDIIGAFVRRGGDKGWFWSLLGGAISIIAGLFLLGNPVASIVALPVAVAVLIGVMAIVSAIFNIIWAIRARKEIQGEAWIILWGVISIILGLWILSAPLGAAASLVFIAAIAAVVGGIAMIIMSFRLRSVAKA